MLFLHLFIYFGYIILQFDYLGHIIKVFCLRAKKLINCIKMTYCERKFLHTIFLGRESNIIYISQFIVLQLNLKIKIIIYFYLIVKKHLGVIWPND